MTIEEMWKVIENIKCEDYTFIISENGQYLQAAYYDRDIVTGRNEIQRTRKWRLSPHMVKSELVQTALKCVLTSHEHRVREHFLYRGRRIYGPHFDVDALWEIAHKLDYRGKTNEQTGRSAERTVTAKKGSS